VLVELKYLCRADMISSYIEKTNTLSIIKEKVLVVDGDSAFLNQTQSRLQNAGYEVFTAENGPIGLKKFFSHRPDILLLNIILPEIDGWEVCRRIRDMSDVPVILVASNRIKSDVLKAFSLGADDFINKPPDFQEMIARVGAVLRRYLLVKKDDKPSIYHHPEIDIDWRTHQVFIRGQQVKLSPIEYKLLTCLIEARGWLVTHEELLRKVWGSDYISDKNFIKLYIRYLRQKIEKDPSRPQLILTERGVGYRFSTQIEEPVG
jgi:two-component system, OmpR family, KDP operon response regulator KdpE